MPTVLTRLILTHSSDGSEDGTVGMRFTYIGVPDEGTSATLQCSEEVQVLVVHQDRSGFALTYEFTTEKGSGGRTTHNKVTLTNKKAKKPLAGKALALGQHGRALAKHVDMHPGTNAGVDFDADDAGEFTLVQAEIEDNGKTLYRSIIAETRSAPPEVADLDLDSATVNGDGDVELQFQGMPTSGHLLLKAMVGMEFRGKPVDDKVELSAMVDDGRLVMHGGWIRKALEKVGATGSTNAWKVFVEEASAFDPENMYYKVAEMTNKKDLSVAENKQLLSGPPSSSERAISEDMKMGRKPKDNRHLRKLTGGVHKKILVHGYW